MLQLQIPHAATKTQCSQLNNFLKRKKKSINGAHCFHTPLPLPATSIEMHLRPEQTHQQQLLSSHGSEQASEKMQKRSMCSLALLFSLSEHLTRNRHALHGAVGSRHEGAAQVHHPSSSSSHEQL